MVSSNGGADRMYKRRRTCSASPPAEDTLTPVQQQQTARHRKQNMMSRLSDSGFGEDLISPFPSPVRAVASPLDEPETPATGELSNWHRHYGDIGYRIQKENEAQFHSCKCLALQPQVTAEARCKLVSWLIPVHKHFHLSFECCCLAVNIMDRFLASTPVAADCFQLLGITALLIASKQVEVFSPQISQLLSLCCDAFTKEQLCNLECLILLRLNFRLAAPTLAFFLDYYANCGEATQLVACNTGGDRSARNNPDPKRPRHCSNLARRVCELSLADYAFNKYPASLTAGCALRIARELQGLEETTDQSETQKHSPKLIHSQEDGRSSFADELCDNEQSFEKTSLAVEGHYLSVVQESHGCSLAQECRENLKLLVSLNQETLQVMLTM
ncbi:cyclin-O protein B-like [Diretmus argenteus]